MVSARVRVPRPRRVPARRPSHHEGAATRTVRPFRVGDRGRGRVGTRLQRPGSRGRGRGARRGCGGAGRDALAAVPPDGWDRSGVAGELRDQRELDGPQRGPRRHAPPARTSHAPCAGLAAVSSRRGSLSARGRGAPGTARGGSTCWLTEPITIRFSTPWPCEPTTITSEFSCSATQTIIGPASPASIRRVTSGRHASGSTATIVVDRVRGVALLDLEDPLRLLG